MKKKSKSLRFSKIFKNYLYSNIIILFILVNVLGMAYVWNAGNNMRKEEVRILENKLWTIVEDMEMQLNSMHRVTLDIVSLQVFRSNYFQTNKYYEIELLNYLESYRHDVNLCEKYFIKYNDINNIFTSEGSTIPSRLYYIDKIGLEEFETFQELMLSMVESDEKVVIYKQDDVTIFLYPLSKYTTNKEGRNGTLCFIVSEENFINRFKSIVGEMDGKISLYYKDDCILGEAGEKNDNDICVTSQGGDFVIHFSMDESSYFSWHNVFETKVLILFAGVIILLFVLGYAGAWLSVKPIQVLVNKYKTVYNDEMEADWNSIDMLIESLLRGKERNSQLIQKQYQILKESIIRLVAFGGYSDRVKEHMILLGINLEASVYSIIECDFTKEQEIEIEYNDICKSMEDLSDDDVQLFSFFMESKKIGILVALEEECQMDEVVEMLFSLLGVKNLEANIEVTGFYRDLKEIKQRKREKQGSDRSVMSIMQEEENVQENIKCVGSRIALKIIDFIEANCTDYNMTLDMAAQEFQISPTHLSRIIKQQTGRSYREYLIDVRIQKAKEMLKDPNITVTDVCQQIGYNNASHFIKVFRKHTGITPAKYKEMLEER